MAATERIMGLVSQRLMLLILGQIIAMETSVITAAILEVTLSIFGLNSFVLIPETYVGTFLENELHEIIMTNESK